MNIKFRAWHEETKDMYYMEKREFLGQTAIIDPMAGHEVAIWQMFSGRVDSQGRDIYEGDIVKCKDIFGTHSYIGTIEFGKYSQDGSGGEYSPTDVMGFYIKALPNQVDEDGDPLLYEFNLERSLLEVDNLKVVGNIFENKNLLSL